MPSVPLMLALRATYLGLLVLGQPPLELFGGMLLRLARRSFGLYPANRDGHPVEDALGDQDILVDLTTAAFHTDPLLDWASPTDRCDTVDAALGAWKLLAAFRDSADSGGPHATPQAAGLARDLWRMLQPANAEYLVRGARVAYAEALACPSKLEGLLTATELPALVCARCHAAHAATPVGGPLGLVAVREYDHTVVCPLCGAGHVHPIWPKVDRRIHPVARCFGSPPGGCQAHGGKPLAFGLCDEGRAIYARAHEIMAARDSVEQPLDPWAKRLRRALARGKRRDQDERAWDEHAERSRMSAMDRFGESVSRALERFFAPPRETSTTPRLPAKRARKR